MQLSEKIAFLSADILSASAAFSGRAIIHTEPVSSMEQTSHNCRHQLFALKL